MKPKISLVLLTAITFSNFCFAQTLVTNMSSTNGDVYSVYKSGGAYYIGGNFTYVGLKTGYNALVKNNNDRPDMSFPAATNGQVYSAIPDGSGGWYIGGYFTLVAGVNKNYIAHILSNKTVDPNFTASCNYAVLAMAKVGTTLYIGGGFTTVNGSTRTYAAAVKTSTGALINNWNPAPNNYVRTIAPVLGSDTTIWLGGDFTLMNTSKSRPYLAKVNNTNGSVITGTLSADQTVWKLTTRGDSVIGGGGFTRLGLKTAYLASISEGSTHPDQTMPEANGRIICIIPDGSGGWYVGGAFTQIGGVNKNYIAHILSNRTVDPNFTASCDSWVWAIVKDGSRLYIGGYFGNVNLTARNRLAAVSASTGALVSSWNPGADNTVKTLALRDTVVLAGGDFTHIKGKNAFRFAALNKTDGTPIGGFPGFNNTVNRIAVKNDSLLIGGAFYNAGNYSPYSAKVTTSSVTLDPRFPATNGRIYTVVPDGSGNYYVAGSFTQIGGVNQAYIAKLNSTFQVVTSWAPAVNAEVHTIVLLGTTVYIGGSFSITNGVSRVGLSALSTSNPGANKTWNSSVNNQVRSLVTDGTSIYAGGYFTQVNGSTTRNRLAKFNTSGTLDASWDPNANSNVEQLAIAGTSIIAGGSFNQMGATARNFLALLNNTTGASSNWATANSTVYALFSDGTTCFVGGSFNQLTSKSGTINARNFLGAITISTGAVTAFNPSPNSTVLAITKSGTNIYYGGSFTLVNGIARNYVATSNTSGTLQSWDASPNYVVYGLSADASNNIFIGGDFSGFKERSQQRAAVVRYATQVLASWQPTIDQDVYDITYTPDKIVIGGAFDNVNGSSRNGLAAFSFSGALRTTSLNLSQGGVGTSAAVFSIFASGNKIYVGGYFDNANGTARSNFVEEDITTGAGTILATNSIPDNIVYAINVQGSSIVYGGDFGFSSVTFRNHLAIIKSASLTVAPFNHNVDYRVFDIAYNTTRLFVVGEFDNVDGVAHRGAAAFNLSSGALLTWNPQLSNNGTDVYADLTSVAADSLNVYLGGNFTAAGAQARTYAAAVSASTGSVLSWNPSPSYIVRTIGYTRATTITDLLLGGDFQHCKGATRNYVAKIDSATGLVNPTWNPGANYVVNAITGSGSNIYIGGNFTSLAGVSRNSLGAVNASTGVATSFDPNIQINGSAGTVNTLAFDASGVLYVGGYFNTVKGTTRNFAASLTTGGAGTLQAWNPNANNQVFAIAITGSTVYLGGQFTTLNGGTARNFFAAVNNTNGTVTSFNPGMNSYVNALSISNNNILYVGGYFTMVANNTIARNRLAAYNATSGALTSWAASADNTVFAVAASTDSTYVGGDFGNLNGSARTRFGAVRTSSGTTLLPVNTAMDQRVQSHYIANRVLLVGGYFDNIDGNPRGGFAVYKLPGSSFAASAQSPEYSMISKPESSLKIYPNPSNNGIVTLQLDKNVTGKFAVNVTSLNGKQVYQKTFESFKGNVIRLNLSALKSGTYLVNIRNDKINWSNKVVIER